MSEDSDQMPTPFLTMAQVRALRPDAFGPQPHGRGTVDSLGWLYQEVPERRWRFLVTEPLARDAGALGRDPIVAVIVEEETGEAVTDPARVVQAVYTTATGWVVVDHNPHLP